MLDKQHEILESIAKIQNLKDLENLRVSLFGKNGTLTNSMKDISNLSIEEKKDLGAKLNSLKNLVQEALVEKREYLIAKEIEEKLLIEKLDITQPIRNKKIGKIHPITQVTQEVVNIFASLGFSMASGPEIEDDYHNFTALNIPENHPARQMHDTFYLNTETKMVLRTHTSTVQIRKIEEGGEPPFRFISPGRVYRSDHDQTHSPMFHQVEGVYIDKEVNMGHLKFILQNFFNKFFEVDDIVIRLRPSFFPFTEPSAEVDIGYKLEDGAIKIGSSEKWMEVLGCGMVHRKVIENLGLDPEKYQGFAFGMGLDRLAMLKYGISDLRKFFESDMRWLQHYSYSWLDFPSFISGLSR